MVENKSFDVDVKSNDGGDKSNDGTDVVLYDGECGFCRSQIKFLKRLDTGQRLRIRSLHESSVATDYPDLSHQQLMEQMWIITRQGARFGGADAVRYLTSRLPWLYPLAPLLYFPGSMPCWRFLYRVVARFRYRIAGKVCNDGACEIHARPHQSTSLRD